MKVHMTKNLKRPQNSFLFFTATNQPGLFHKSNMIKFSKTAVVVEQESENLAKHICNQQVHGKYSQHGFEELA